MVKGLAGWSQASGLELFAGKGILTKVFSEAGLAMEASWDICNGLEFDLLDPEVFKRLLKLLATGRVRWVLLAPPCWSHSAVQNGRTGGPLRSKEFPEGVDR